MNEGRAAAQGPDSAFVSRRARREYWIFCLATFLAFLTSATLSFLSVILAAEGMAADQIGIVLSAPIVSITVAILLSGEIVHRLGAYRTTLIGLCISVLSYASFEFTIGSPLGAAISRILFGVGFGLVFPAVMVHARGFLQGPRTAYFFGIFSCMLPLPQVLGPGLAEWYFGQFGTRYLFVWFVLPTLAAIAIMLLAMREQRRHRPAFGQASIGYGALLADRRIALPNFAIFSVGLIWGFSASFMALLLHRYQVPISYFFSTCTATMLVSRFTLLSKLSLWPQPLPAAIGLVCMGGSYFFITGGAIEPWRVLLTGLVFGIGHSMAFPILGTWVSDQFGLADRGKPMALFSAMFNFGIFLSPILIGFGSGSISLEQSMIVLGGLGLAVAAMLIWHQISTQRRAG